MVRRPNYKKRFLFFLVTLGAVSLLVFPEFQRRLIRLVEIPVGGAIFHVQRGSSSVVKWVDTIWSGYVNLSHVQEENEHLRRTISMLRGENNLLREEGAAIQRLYLLLDYKKISSLSLVTAEVIGRNPTQWFHTIMINRGEDDGVRVDMGVITPSGVVGRIIKVGPRYALVLLVTDRNSAIAAIVQRTRDEGIVQGIDEGSLQLKYFARFAKVEIGDTVVTSGLEGSFAKGLKIGQIEQVEKKEHEMFLQVSVRPEVDFSKLEEVFVLTSTDVPGNATFETSMGDQERR